MAGASLWPCTLFHIFKHMLPLWTCTCTLSIPSNGIHALRVCRQQPFSLAFLTSIPFTPHQSFILPPHIRSRLYSISIQKPITPISPSFCLTLCILSIFFHLFFFFFSLTLQIHFPPYIHYPSHSHGPPYLLPPPWSFAPLNPPFPSELSVPSARLSRSSLFFLPIASSHLPSPSSLHACYHPIPLSSVKPKISSLCPRATKSIISSLLSAHYPFIPHLLAFSHPVSRTPNTFFVSNKDALQGQ